MTRGVKNQDEFTDRNDLTIGQKNYRRHKTQYTAKAKEKYARLHPNLRKWYHGDNSRVDVRDFPAGWSNDPKYKYEYRRRYRKTIPREIEKAKLQLWRDTHRPELAIRQRATRRALRLAALEALGGKCICVRDDCWHSHKPCGIIDSRVLSFNHIIGGGRSEMEKKSDRRFLREIAAGKRNDDIEVNCHNCNWVHARENGLQGKL